MEIKSVVQVGKEVEIILPLINRTFDGIYLRYQWKPLGHNFPVQNLNIDQILLGYTRLSFGNLVYILNLNELSDKEIFCEDFYVYEIEYLNRKIWILVWIKWWKINFLILGEKLPELEIFINSSQIIVKNKILDTIIFEKTLDLKWHHIITTEKLGNITSNKRLLELISLYEFNNLFFSTETVEFPINVKDDFLIKIGEFKSEWLIVKQTDIFRQVELNLVWNYFHNLFKKDLQATFIKDFVKFVKFKNRYFAKVDSHPLFKDLFPKGSLITNSVVFLEKFDFDKVTFEEFDKDLIDFQNSIVYIQYLLYSLEKVKTNINNMNLSWSEIRWDFVKRLKILNENILKIRSKLKSYFLLYLQNLLK